MIEIIDVDQHEKLADRFNARTLPTSVIFAQGEIVEVLPGYQTLDFLQSYLSHIIKQVEEMKEAEKND
jgi:thioredoxin-like negative regulator of GroEL